MKSLPVGLSAMPDLTALRWFSDNSQRDVHFDKDVVRRTDWSRRRAAEQVFRTRGLMLSGAVAESESRFDSKLSTLSGEKDTESKNIWM